jgi:hypothetical protein
VERRATAGHGADGGRRGVDGCQWWRVVSGVDFRVSELSRSYLPADHRRELRRAAAATRRRRGEVVLTPPSRGRQEGGVGGRGGGVATEGLAWKLCAGRRVRVAQALPAARGGWRVWEAEEEEGAVRTGGVAVETGRERGGWQRQGERRTGRGLTHSIQKLVF